MSDDIKRYEERFCLHKCIYSDTIKLHGEDSECMK